VDEVHLWLAFQGEAESPACLDRYRAALPEDERLAADRFYFESGRRQALITRALVRSVLSRYCDVAPEDWRFVRDDRGRPHVVPEQRAHGVPAFNLSHTQGLILCAVTGAPAVGADVEHVHERRSSLDVADRYFAAAEARALQALPQEQQTDRFFHYWTLKESYIKARGKGLAIPLEHFAFDFEGERSLSVRFEPSLQDDAGKWCFWLCRPSPEHIAAVCVRAEPGTRPSLAMGRIVPLHSEQPFDCEVLRASRR
jgi:4'-phosphopantetheinyl transferase